MPLEPCQITIAMPTQPSSQLSTARLQKWRQVTQGGFFLLFLTAPALNLLRFDLSETQLWFFGQRWSLGIDALAHGQVDATTAALQIILRAFVPAVLFIAVFLGVAYRYGRLYCGWLCPHFSMVEGLNTLLHRACGKLSVWDKSPTPRAGAASNASWWPLFGISCALMGFVWAITLLTYLLPPSMIWLVAWHADTQSNSFSVDCKHVIYSRICICTPFVLPLWMCCGFVSEPGLDGQPKRHGGGVCP